ncbi:hypothetical protein [Peptoniphilus obesi]|uniref:hypothetical protein n=1 Tax=Peptoniphilus obesi TaxID=1472765 RepID=UPI0004B6A23F|nr:hypothetical protein [Peptoniphilus obesi]
MINKEEVLEIYLREMTKYMTYENSLQARDDFIYILEENIGKDYSKEKLENYLQDLGSPYSLASSYRDNKDILITGKNYVILNKLLKTFFLSFIISIVISFFIKNIADEKLLYFFEVSKSLILTIFLSSVISAWISERVKNTKILTSLLKAFSIKELYNYKNTYRIKNSRFIICFVYSFIIFISAFMEYDLDLKNYIFLLELAFFFLVFRDFSYFSEGSYGRYVTMVNIASNTIAILIFMNLAKNVITFKAIKLAYYLLVILGILKILTALKRSNRTFYQLKD